MARLTFSDEGSRLVYSPGLTGAALLNGVGTVVTMYSDAGCTVLADIQTVGGVAIASAQLTVDANSLLPLFLGPADGTDTLYAKPAGANAASASKVYARADDRIDSLVTGVAANATGLSTTNGNVTALTTALGVTNGNVAANATAVAAKIDTATALSSFALRFQIWKTGYDYIVGDIITYNAVLYQVTNTHTSGGAIDLTKFYRLTGGELAFAENITGTNVTTSVATGATTDITGLSVAVPVYPRPVSIELQATFTHSVDNGVCLVYIAEVSNGVDTPKIKQSAFFVPGGGGLVAVRHSIRIPSAARTRTFKAQMAMFTPGTMGCNVGNGTNVSDYECSLTAIGR